MNDLINILLNSSVLRGYVGNRIYPNYTTCTDDCIVYSYETISNNRARRQLRLTITIIAGDLVKAEAIEAEVGALLLTLEGAPLTSKIISVTQNGGGSLFDNARNKNHRIMYFDIISRNNY